MRPNHESFHSFVIEGYRHRARSRSQAGRAGIETHWANDSAKSDKTISTTNRALREADEIFVILTNESVDDPNLMVALGAAYSTRRHVTPIVVGLQTSEIPSLIKSLKYIKYPELNRYIADMASRARAA